jgi:hypothetical protein
VSAHKERQDLHGLADPRLRFSIGLSGAPARSLAEIAKAPARLATGVAVTVMPPWGQNTSQQLVNLGYGRWAVKPEFGATRTFGQWTADGAAGVWLFTANNHYFPDHRRKKQSPLASLQGHISYALPHRLWAAMDGAWFAGGQTRIDGMLNPDEQRNTRVGGTLSIPIGKMQSMKLTYSTGATTRRGTDFDSFSVMWQLVRM